MLEFIGEIVFDVIFSGIYSFVRKRKWLGTIAIGAVLLLLAVLCGLVVMWMWKEPDTVGRVMIGLLLAFFVFLLYKVGKAFRAHIEEHFSIQ